MKKSEITSNLEKLLFKLTKHKNNLSPFSKNYIIGRGHCQQEFLNLKVPPIRQLIKKADYNLNEILCIWNETNFYEAKSFCLYWMISQDQDFLFKNANILIRWAHQIDNWAHSDGLSYLLAKIYEINPLKLKNTYLKWNRDKNPWLRRLSIVSLFYYSNLRAKNPPFNQAKKIVHPLLKDPDYYVQKGVGWTLREMYNVYPDKTLIYIKENIHQISSVAWIAASEKLNSKDKLTLKQLRQSKKARS